MITCRDPHRARLACVLAWGGAAVSWELSTPGPLGPSLATCAAFLVLATGSALHIRRRLIAELRRSREIARATQRVLLRPLPGRIDGLALCAAQLSASRGAAVGGDLYEAVPTAYGVRMVIGDVRGHGLPALGAAAAVLGSFREAAYDEPSLGGVLLRMERSLRRHLRAEPAASGGEEFVTVLLLQIAPDNTVLALNCGHPWPYLLRRAAVREPCGAFPPPTLPPFPPQSPAGLGSRSEFQPARRLSAPGAERTERGPGRSPGERGKGGAGRGSAQRHHEVRALDGGETWPPLGVLPVPPGVRAQELGQLHPGEALLLHTDGAEDARDHHGRFFPLTSHLAEQQTLTPARLVAGVHAALLRHTGGRIADDVALLALRNDRP
ncbi:PP2C family protein-serine/threonine phosphatase [Streptomyces sp. NPDC089915]|uniref:PP2C family protein-serine/threonine phosphatase n=1 Tax=Streptomyces sp. NPDC089915 TaxID=3155186 RepID=UPI003412FFE5